MLVVALHLNVLALASAFELNVLDSALPLNMLDLASPWNQILQHRIWSDTMSKRTRLFGCYVDAITCPSAVLRLKVS